MRVLTHVCLWWQTVRKCTHISLTVPSRQPGLYETRPSAYRALRNGRNTFAFIRDVKPDCDVILYILLRFMHPKHLTNLNAFFKNNRVLGPWFLTSSQAPCVTEEPLVSVISSRPTVVVAAFNISVIHLYQWIMCEFYHYLPLTFILCQNSLQSTI